MLSNMQEILSLQNFGWLVKVVFSFKTFFNVRVYAFPTRDRFISFNRFHYVFCWRPIKNQYGSFYSKETNFLLNVTSFSSKIMLNRIKRKQKPEIVNAKLNFPYFMKSLVWQKAQTSDQILNMRHVPMKQKVDLS